MGIRKATPADQRALAELVARAYIDDPFLGDYLHPYRREYPEDFLAFLENSVWIKSNDFAREHVVSIDEETGKIAACATWLRIGPGAAKRPNPLSLRIKKQFAVNAVKVYEWLWPDRSADPAHIALFTASMPLTKHHWSGDRKDGWMLERLCTDPQFQNKGHASACVKYGLEKVDAEGVRCSLIASHEKESFYERFGFKVVGKANESGPLAGVKGGAIMFRDAKK